MLRQTSLPGLLAAAVFLLLASGCSKPETGEDEAEEETADCKASILILEAPSPKPLILILETLNP